MSDPILVGQKQTIRMRFRPGGGYASPTTVSCRVRKPSGSIEACGVFVEVDGNGEPIDGWFFAYFTPDEPGPHVCRVDGAGVVDGIGEFAFIVHDPEVPAP